MLGDSPLPDDVRRLCKASSGMSLRCRFNNDVEGLFVLNSDHEIEREDMARFVECLSDDELESMRIGRV